MQQSFNNYQVNMLNMLTRLQEKYISTQVLLQYLNFCSLHKDHFQFMSHFLLLTGGYLADSLAIMTDAAHLLTDFASFMISLFSLWLASRPATKRMHWGYYRAGTVFVLSKMSVEICLQTKCITHYTNS